MMTLKVEKKIRTDHEKITKVLNHFKEKPDLYQFNTHQGIYPIKQPWYQQGAKFYTIEKFIILPIKLKFKTVKFTNKVIILKLLKPLKHILIKFKLKKQNESSIISITVQPTQQNIRNRIIFNPISIYFVKKQLKKELTFISQKLRNL